MFSKNLLRQLPDGTKQASGWSKAHSALEPFDKLRVNGLNYYKFSSTLRNKYAGYLLKRLQIQSN